MIDKEEFEFHNLHVVWSHTCVSKTPPQYIYLNDVWERETDHKKFSPYIDENAWIAADGEKVMFPKKAKIMGNRD